jgi:hypothetical protein
MLDVQFVVHPYESVRNQECGWCGSKYQIFRRVTDYGTSLDEFFYYQEKQHIDIRKFEPIGDSAAAFIEYRKFAQI